MSEDTKYANRPDYCGIEGVKFIFIDEYADPQLYYNGKLYNAVDLEENFFEEYKAKVAIGEFTGRFGDYLNENAIMVCAALEDLQPIVTE